MNSIISEHRAIEYMIHRFSLIDLHVPSEHTAEELAIADKAKKIILQNYHSPPSIKELARLCATNDFKLKKHFKKVCQTTIYAYIQKLRSFTEASLPCVSVEHSPSLALPDNDSVAMIGKSLTLQRTNFTLC